jgi:hypothetical protein
MNLAQILKLLHVATAFWLIAGVLGRYVVLSTAEHSMDIQAVRTLLPVANIFERAMVIPGTNAVFIAGLLTAWVQGWPILGFLQGGKSNWVLVSLLLLLSLIPIIAFVFVPRGKIFGKAFEESVAKGQVTPELTAAFRDPVVRAAHIYELLILVVIVILMVLKPF